MDITARDVKALREKTGCGMMDCKKALVKAGGDTQAAVDILRKRGLDVFAKKSQRTASEGVAVAVVNEDRTVGVCIEINSETDFVAKNSRFLDFVNTCAQTVIHSNPANVEELLETDVYGGKGDKVDDLLKENILVIGENIRIRRFKRFEGVVSGYTHANGRMASLVKFSVSSGFSRSEEFAAFSDDIAVHVVASNPLYIDEDFVPPEVIEHERGIFLEQVSTEGKPANIAEKIVEGRMKKFYKEVCLLKQDFVKNPDYSIANYINEISRRLGIDVSVEEFVKYERGEGI
ncbi:MAG: translation elongation factor Ts [Oscillospiraceae bacterium]|jgi:elongation factor Ts|nr:translation elongation factor Ts [Oscillospiraceae bacterium]